ncbi:MAG: bacillithiol biosynthesis cysteine-adding enzyme BshC [Gemmatimonadaceae bacterium]
MSDARIVTEPLGGGAIVRARADGLTPPSWYPPTPRTADEWRDRAQTTAARARPQWLAAVAPALAASGAAAERLARTAAAGGVVVTTGQQPGLFGGPVYTWTKAFSALALADAVERCTGVSTAPIFWAATDDADFAEGSWTAIANGPAVERLALPRRTDVGRPMADLPLGDVKALVTRLMTAAGSAPDARVRDAVAECYGAGRTMGSAYVALLRTLLEPLGIAVLDASHPAVRAAARPLLEQALAGASAIDQALESRSAELRRHGLHPQVAAVRGLSLVFTVADGVRRRLPIPASGAPPAPADLGPNVLLRPVVEQWLLPTVGYVAGPAELAYFAQVSAVAGALGQPLPLALPRWSCTVVEPRVARILARRGLTAVELADPHAAEARLARSAMSSDLTLALRSARESAIDAMDAVAAAAGPLLDPQAVARARGAAAHHVQRLERRIVAAIKRGDDAVRRDLAAARASLYPLGKRQERILNFLPLLARYGDRLRDDMIAAARTHAERVLGAAPAAPAAAASARTARAGRASP